MSHLAQVAVVRRHITQQEYAEALHIGRDELANGRDSPELLILMATAVLLGDGKSGSLDEAREWLERAIDADPKNVEASLELAHFLDAVADEEELAAVTFEAAATQTIEYLEDALAGLRSTGTERRREVRSLLQNLIDVDTSEED